MEKSILVIDDNEDILWSMRQALELKQYKVKTWNHFPGCERVAKIAPSVIFLDYTIGLVEAGAVMKKLRAFKPTEKLPVVLVSAWTEIRDRARDIGADDFLAKPYSLEALWGKAALYAV